MRSHPVLRLLRRVPFDSVDDSTVLGDNGRHWRNVIDGEEANAVKLRLQAF